MNAGHVYNLYFLIWLLLLVWLEIFQAILLGGNKYFHNIFYKKNINLAGKY